MTFTTHLLTKIESNNSRNNLLITRSLKISFLYDERTIK